MTKDFEDRLSAIAQRAKQNLTNEQTEAEKATAERDAEVERAVLAVAEWKRIFQTLNSVVASANLSLTNAGFLFEIRQDNNFTISAGRGKAWPHFPSATVSIVLPPSPQPGFQTQVRSQPRPRAVPVSLPTLAIKVEMSGNVSTKVSGAGSIVPDTPAADYGENEIKMAILEFAEIAEKAVAAR